MYRSGHLGKYAPGAFGHPTFVESPMAGSFDPLRTRLDESTYLRSPSPTFRETSPIRVDHLRTHLDEPTYLRSASPTFREGSPIRNRLLPHGDIVNAHIDTNMYSKLILRNTQLEARLQELEAENQQFRIADLRGRCKNSPANMQPYIVVKPEDIKIAELEAEVEFLRRKLQEKPADWETRNPLRSQTQNIRDTRKGMREKPLRSVGASRSAPRKYDWSRADKSKWKFQEVQYSGCYTFCSNTKPVFEECAERIELGRQKLHANPDNYLGIFYQSNVTQWPIPQQKYTMVKRTGSGFHVKEIQQGPFTFIHARYCALQQGIVINVDRYTDQMHYEGYHLKCRSPGRGEGCADIPGLKIIGDVDPSDVAQGAVGDCWLLSAISSLAEFDGAIARLFRKTSGISSMPRDSSNTYTITLYDLRTWSPVDIEVDERLCYKADDSGILGAAPSIDGELWVCYLEKALAIHCGGWDKIDGGTCTHGWRLLTGCKQQYWIHKDKSTGSFECLAQQHPQTGQWANLENSPKDCSGVLFFKSQWPDVGGADAIGQQVNEMRMFEKMCAWDDRNYLMGAGTKAGSDHHDTDGIVDGHAYSVLQCINNAGGTEIDMLKLRNPWGRGEFQRSKWTDNGPGWYQYPQVKQACNPVVADDGVFWMERSEFFKYFPTIYLCAHDMSEFVK